ncbi:MAG: hypothetical protein IPN01_36060 [Deltaproteobacteria bacterium]|nr:hypothetical protein [Deltaproteobacteria bacterium]
MARFAAVFGYIASDAEQVDEGDAREEVTSAFAAASEELLSSFLQVLADIGDVLDWALHEDDAADLRDLVRGCFESEELRPHILGGFHHSWWLLAWHLLGKDFVVEKLAEGDADRPNGEATRWRLDALTNAGLFDALVFPLAQHEMLGDQAVAVIAARIVGTRADLMLKALESRPLVIDNQPVPSTPALARRLAQADPERAVELQGLGRAS